MQKRVKKVTSHLDCNEVQMGRRLSTTELQGIAVPRFSGLFHKKQHLVEQAPPTRLSQHFSSTVGVQQRCPLESQEKISKWKTAHVEVTSSLCCLERERLKTQPSTFNTGDVLQQKAQLLEDGLAMKHVPFVRNENSRSHNDCHSIQLEMPRWTVQSATSLHRRV